MCCYNQQSAENTEEQSDSAANCDQNWSTLVLNWFWTYNPGEKSRRFVLGHQLPLVRAEHRPLGDVWIHAANVHLVPVREDLQARGDGEGRPVGRAWGRRCVRDKPRRPVGQTLRLEIVLALFTDWSTDIWSFDTFQNVVTEILNMTESVENWAADIINRPIRAQHKTFRLCWPSTNHLLLNKDGQHERAPKVKPKYLHRPLVAGCSHKPLPPCVSRWDTVTWTKFLDF